MQWSVQPVTDLDSVLPRIVAVAVAHRYFAGTFMSTLLAAAVCGPMDAGLAQLQRDIHAMQWTIVTALDDHHVVGFAATAPDDMCAVKTRTITWFFVTPDCRDTVEPLLLRHLETHDAAGCADVVICAELDIDLWRRLARHGYALGRVRICSRGPRGIAVDAELMDMAMQTVGHPSAVNSAPVHALRRLAAMANALIERPTSTLDTFRSRFPVFINRGTVETANLTKTLMPGEVFLPGGPRAANLPLPF